MRLQAFGILITQVCLLIIAQPLFAQSQASDLAARKVDEWGHFSCDDAMARLDYFAEQLRNTPNAQAYIIGYDGRNSPVGRIRRHLNMTKPYLVNVRGINEERVRVINGGHREDLIVEYWIVPNGAVPPAPSPTVQVPPHDIQSARKFDEGFADFLISDRRPVLWTYDMCALSAPDLKDFADMLKGVSRSRGYFIVYSEFGRPRNRANTVMRLLRDEMAQHGIDSRRIVTVYGGRRRIPSMELWLLPEGASIPNPMPARN